jgi:hypothetical protein
MYNIRYEKEV